MFEGIGSVLGAGLGQLGDVLSAPRRAVWNAIGLPDSGTDLVHNVTGMDKESMLTKALGMGAEVLGDPLTYVGAGLGRLGGTAAKAATAGAEAASPVSKMLNLRRGFGVVKDIAPAAEAEAAGLASPRAFEVGGDMVGKFAGGRVPSFGYNDAASQFIRGPEGATTNGFYLPRGEGGPGAVYAMKASANPNTLRHEMIHGLMDQARAGGDLSSLPLAMRVPAWMQQRSSPLLRGLGEFGEEAVAHSLENRGLVSQLMGGARFIAKPNQFYLDQLAKASPLAAGLVGNAPKALGIGALGAGAGAAGYLGLSE